MRNLPVSDETAATVLALQETLDTNADTLVALAAAALALKVERQWAGRMPRPPVASDVDLQCALVLVKTHGRRWVELAVDGRTARVQLRETEVGA